MQQAGQQSRRRSGMRRQAAPPPWSSMRRTARDRGHWTAPRRMPNRCTGLTNRRKDGVQIAHPIRCLFDRSLDGELLHFAFGKLPAFLSEMGIAAHHIECACERSAVLFFADHRSIAANHRRFVKAQGRCPMRCAIESPSFRILWIACAKDRGFIRFHRKTAERLPLTRAALRAILIPAKLHQTVRNHPVFKQN